MNIVTTLAIQTPPDPDLGEIAATALYYLGLSAATGVGLTLAYLIPRSGPGGILAGRAHRIVLPVTVFVAITGVLELVTGEVKGESEGRAGTGPGGGDGLGPGGGDGNGPGTTLDPDVVSVIQWGGYVLLVLALVGLYLRSGRAFGWSTVAAAVATGLAPYIPWGAHSVNRVARDVLNGIHVTGTFLWVGGLLILGVLGLLGFAKRGAVSSDERSQAADEWARVWERFSAIALWAVGMILVSGTWMTWVHVGTPEQMLTTAYGRYLGIKLLMVGGLLAAGTFNVTVLLPRIRTAQEAGDETSAFRLAARRFPTVVTAEIMLATGVLCVLPFLEGSARQEAGWPAARSFDWTVFGVGVVLVGLIALALWSGSRVAARRTPRQTISG
ncbi:MAG: CopD family protein [Actinomycetota bacterium]|nr:CopD family protein [Actinomycetota bacterium]